jgi:hypothetical protein
MHSVSCLIPASNTQHVELGRVKGRRRRTVIALPLKKKKRQCDDIKQSLHSNSCFQHANFGSLELVDLQH